MNLPFELIQKEISLTPAAADGVRARAEQLDRFCGRIMRSRVTVEGPSRHHRQGTYSVTIDLTVPGREIVVRKKAEANLDLALKDAFAAAGRQLEDHVRRSRGFTKTHEPR